MFDLSTAAKSLADVGYSCREICWLLDIEEEVAACRRSRLPGDGGPGNILAVDLRPDPHDDVLCDLSAGVLVVLPRG